LGTEAIRNTVISGIGMISPVGQGAAQTFCSVRARITRTTEVPQIYFCLPDDPDFEAGEPLVASTIQYLDDRREEFGSPEEWLALLASLAFSDLRMSADLTLPDFRETGLFLSLPSKRSNWDEARREEFLYHFHNNAEIDPFPHNQVAFTGHAGVLSLVGAASDLLSKGTIRYALVGGVDAYLFPEWLKDLDKGYRIKSQRSVTGFIPGEAAGFLLLELEGRSPRRSPLGYLKRISIHTGAAQDRSPAAALTTILTTLLDDCSDAPVIICDLNGETARMKEWGYAIARIGSRLGNPIILEHPAISLGDVGAASGALLTGLAPSFLTKKYPHKSSAIIWTASDNGDRAAVLVQNAANAIEPKI